MFKTTRTLITAGLALILFGGIASPSVVHADSTEAIDHSAVTTKAANTKTQITVGSIEMPYTLVSGKEGNVNLYQYPNAPKVLTAAEINDSDYMAKLEADNPNFPAHFTQQLQNILTGFSDLDFDLNETMIDQALAGDPDMNKDETLNMMRTSTYMQAWIISRIAQEKTHQIDYEALNAEYLKTLRPMILTVPKIQQQLKQFDSVFNSSEQTYRQVRDIYFSMFTSNNGLGANYTTEQLTALDPDATGRQAVALYNKPLSYFIQKQADGTYRLSGLYLNDLMAYSFWFEDTPITPDPTPTPTTSEPVTVHYVDDQGQALKPDKTLTGKLGESYKTTPLDIDGYALTQTTGEESGTFGSTAKTVTYTYSAVLTSGGAADTIAPEGTVIYATKKIGLYKNATFTNKARKQWYAKKSRINRPMFVVTGYAKSKNGVERYHVKDVNHHSKTADKTGYVTANAKYTSRVYYATKQKTITVINPKGVNAYSKKNLTNKKAHYRQGQVLKVKKIVNQNLTTRFVLSNGRYVTANKLLVKTGKQAIPKRVQAKTALNRYDNVNLTKRNQHYTKKSHATFKVKGWTYSNANDFSKGDTLRYQVAGGYISGNRQFVSILK